MNYGDETVTGIINVNGNGNVNGNWYDLQGRKVNGQWNKKVYIIKGKKVIK